MASIDASAAALGFSYQLRWALLELIEAAEEDQTSRLTLEIVDDVAITDEGGKNLRAIQLKQHRDGPKLTDRSVDLWKTIGNWLLNPQLADAHGPLLWLITTSKVASGSAASFLGPDVNLRNEKKALALLDRAANDAVSKDTESARMRWKKASEIEKNNLISRVRVIGNAPGIFDVDRLIRKKLKFTVREKDLEHFTQRLWGWWESRCLDLLKRTKDHREITSIGADVLVSTLQEFRDDYQNESLHLDQYSSEIDDELVRDYDSKLFIEQLAWIEIRGTNRRRAMTDYHFTYGQFGKWLGDGDLVASDVEKYRENVYQEWKTYFEDIEFDLAHAVDIDDEKKIILGRALYRTLRDVNGVRLRKHLDHSVITPGMRHMLANDARIGWHPEYEDRIKARVTGPK